MKVEIKDPYKASHKTYVIIALFSLVTLILSLLIPTSICEFITVLFDVIKNLSYGCIASTVVAWLIDCANVRNLNKKANESYEAIYGDLKFKIAYYIGTWAELCSVAYKDIDYYQEKMTWKEWYLKVKDNYEKSEENRQHELMHFFYHQLKYCVDQVNKSISEIHNQKYLLTINELTNSKMNQIIADFKFEFYALDLDLAHKDDYEMFWKHMDAITEDIERYINNWTDISYYNFLKFKPYKFHSDTNETCKAILLRDGFAENIINMALAKKEE